MKSPELKFSNVKPLVEYIQKQRENEKFYRSLETVATFLLISFFLFFAIKPTVFTISSLLGEIKSKETLSKNYRNKIGQVVEAQDVFSQVQEKYLVINSALPDSPKFNHLVAQVSQSAQSSSVSLNSIDFNLNQEKQTGKPSSQNLKSYTYSHSLVAGYRQILGFISELAGNRRLMTIKRINLQTIRTKDKEATPSADKNLNASFTTDVYFWQQK